MAVADSAGCTGLALGGLRSGCGRVDREELH